MDQDELTMIHQAVSALRQIGEMQNQALSDLHERLSRIEVTEGEVVDEWTGVPLSTRMLRETQLDELDVRLATQAKRLASTDARLDAIVERLNDQAALIADEVHERKQRFNVLSTAVRDVREQIEILKADDPLDRR